MMQPGVLVSLDFLPSPKNLPVGDLATLPQMVKCVCECLCT